MTRRISEYQVEFLDRGELREKSSNTKTNGLREYLWSHKRIRYEWKKLTPKRD